MAGEILQQTFNVSHVETVTTSLTTKYQRNEFDEFGTLVGVNRLRGEKNDAYRRRLFDAFANRANSSYRGMVNAITRELGLSLFEAIYINPKLAPDGSFLATDPYIVFDGAWLLLYSDYENDLLDWAIDRYQTGGNYEHIGKLVDFVNTTTFFQASIRPNINPYTRSATILNQSNLVRIGLEFIPQSTRFKLKHRHIRRDTIFFSDRQLFHTKVDSTSQITRRGQYHIDYLNGIITCYSIPAPRTTVRYQYFRYPFIATGSPIILNSLSSETFKVKLYNQILLDNNETTHGLPSSLGVNIINELMTVKPMYWGI